MPDPAKDESSLGFLIDLLLIDSSEDSISEESSSIYPSILYFGFAEIYLDCAFCLYFLYMSFFSL